MFARRRSDVVGRARNIDRANHQALVEVAGRSIAAAAARQHLGLEGLVAAQDVGRRARDQHLLRQRQIEERPADSVDFGDQVWIDAVPSDHHEADLAADAIDLRRQSTAAGGISVAIGRNVEDRDRFQGHRRFL
jgi:hypothetical protein